MQKKSLLSIRFSNKFPRRTISRPSPLEIPPAIKLAISFKMPYNTRRKSLSLPSLGIAIPQQKPTPAASSPVVVNETKISTDMPSQKKVKRAHQLSPLSNVTLPANSPYDATPPPSPSPSEPESYDDEIVGAVIDILKKSGNRPHTVKELAVLLMRMLAIVEKFVYLHPISCDASTNHGNSSANPHAIISSRLNQYLKRPGQKKCLLAKELITTHPKRIYFYLTNCERQPIPTQDEAAAFLRQTIVSPAPSDERERTPKERSPSPDVDFMFDDDLIPDTKQTTQKSILTVRRFMSPPLEGDEREFTQSAINIKRRSASRELEEQRRLKRSREEMESDEVKDVVDPLGISSELDGADDVYSASALTNVDDHKHDSWVSVEADESQHRSGEASRDSLSIDTTLAAGMNPWANDVQSPESIGLHELDDLFDF